MTSKELKDMAFEVRDERGRLRAMFETRWQAEKFAEEYRGLKVVVREA